MRLRPGLFVSPTNLRCTLLRIRLAVDTVSVSVHNTLDDHERGVQPVKRVYKMPLVLEPQPEGGYTISCPLVPELVTEADKLDDVQPNVADALIALLELYQDLNKPVPAALRTLVADADSPIWAETLVLADTA